MPLVSVCTPTHDPRWMGDCYRSLLRQTMRDWEWVIVLNGAASLEQFKNLGVDFNDSRVRIRANRRTRLGIGALKRDAFGAGTGKYLVELDHDDMLFPDCLEKVCDAFSNRVADFVYTDSADFSPTGAPCTYYAAGAVESWGQNGWRFAEVELPGGEPYERVPPQHGMGSRRLRYPLSFPPSAATLSLILYAPDHVRAWRREFYEEVGGHAADLEVADDHELIARSYLAGGAFAHVAEALYLHRVSGENSWLRRVHDIQAASNSLRDRCLHRLVERECEIGGYPTIDLGGAIGCPGAPWIPWDKKLDGYDLNERWPWDDSSVGAFRACDILEHLVDKQHAMDEVFRCLRPGGWLLSRTPSALGEGAFSDPDHKSYWVERSFRYYTQRELARYLEPRARPHPQFFAARLFTEGGPVPYVVFDGVSLKAGANVPGFRQI